jgi:RND family efflux transporter MFP subunit
MKRAAVLAGLAFLAACSKAAEPPRGPGAARKAKVSAQEARKQEVAPIIEAAGSIEAAEEISIPARVGGVVDAVHFKEGDEVTPETVLLEIEVEKFALAVRRAEAEHQRAAATADLARTVMESRQKLYEEGRRQGKEWVTEEQMATWRADLQKAEADRDRALVDLEVARRDLRFARVTAPIAGVMNRKAVSKGELVRPETIVGTMLNVSRLYVRFTVPELEAARISPGREIEFSIRSAPGSAFKATVFYMAQKADPTTRAVECKAEILRVDGAASLRPGTFASVRFVSERYQAVLIPQRAVLPTQHGFIVMVLREGRARAVTVQTGLWVGLDVEIAKGLSAGEMVIVDGASGLRDGAEVEVQVEVEEKSASGR